MTVLEALKAARELISVPERWTQGVYARGPDGRPVHPDDPEATCFCALGAVLRVGGKCRWDKFVNPLYIETECTQHTVAGVNDDLGHPAVMALFDRVIAKLETQQ